MQKNTRLLSILIAIVSHALPAMGQSSVKLVWNANPESDLAGYKVHIGTSSGVFTDVRDVGSTTSLVVAELASETTYYFAVQAYNTSNLTSDLSAEVQFTTIPGGAYGEWAAVGSLSGADAAADAVPYHDGVPNILKYAFNMNPAGPDTSVLLPGTGTSGLPFSSVAQNSTGAVFRMEYIRRKSGDLTYAPLISTDLVSYQPMTGDTTVIDISPDWERVVIQKPCDLAATPRLFATVKVILP